LAGPCEYIGFCSKVKLWIITKNAKVCGLSATSGRCIRHLQDTEVQKALALFAAIRDYSTLTANDVARPIRINSSERAPVYTKLSPWPFSQQAQLVHIKILAFDVPQRRNEQGANDR
jgi:hypothetical protein